MTEIRTFQFIPQSSKEIQQYKYGANWPAVYLIEDGREIYIGETTSAITRIKQHLENPIRAKLKKVHIVSDDEFNKSATLDMESMLIEYIAAEGSLRLQNGNGGLRNHNYFDREKYKAKFEVTWEMLKDLKLVSQDLIQLKNTDLFKYSPYKALSDDQLYVVKMLFEKLRLNQSQTFLINGRPGTGKTVLATYLMKYLAEHKETAHLKIGLVIPMTSLRNTLKKVFSKIAGLSSTQVIGPADVVRDKYDILIVDEAHRLKRRVNLSGYGPYDIVNRLLGLTNEGTELDWILKSSTQQIFFYDENQSVRPTDIPREKFSSLQAQKYNLNSQLRVEGGEEYIAYIDDLFGLQKPRYEVRNYDFKIYDDIHQMISDIKVKNREYGLARVVAGYAWPWKTKDKSADFDIEIDGLQLVWNSTTKDWVNSPNAVNEVGCIHTVQGYDLNYAGVILGPEIYFDTDLQKICVNKGKYMDINGKRSVEHPEELERYVINIYKTLLSRGIKGTYVYISDPELKRLFQESIKK